MILELRRDIHHKTDRRGGCRGLPKAQKDSAGQGLTVALGTAASKGYPRIGY